MIEGTIWDALQIDCVNEVEGGIALGYACALLHNSVLICWAFRQTICFVEEVACLTAQTITTV